MNNEKQEFSWFDIWRERGIKLKGLVLLGIRGKESPLAKTAAILVAEH